MERHYSDPVYAYIDSNKVTVKTLKLFAKKLGYNVATNAYKNNITRALIRVIHHIHDTITENRKKSIAIAFPLGALEYPYGTRIDEKTADMRNDLRINQCKTPQELQSLLSASDFYTLELIAHQKRITPPFNTGYTFHKGYTVKSLTALILAYYFPQPLMRKHVPSLPEPQPVTIEAEYTEKAEPETETQPQQTAKIKPSDAPKKQPKGKTTLTLEAVNSCAAREELTALFSQFKKDEILAFMLSIGASLRGLKGLNTKAKLSGYCAAKILQLRDMKPSEQKQAPRPEIRHEAPKHQPKVLGKNRQLMIVF